MAGTWHPFEPTVSVWSKRVHFYAVQVSELEMQCDVFVTARFKVENFVSPIIMAVDHPFATCKALTKIYLEIRKGKTGLKFAPLALSPGQVGEEKACTFLPRGLGTRLYHTYLPASG